MGLAGELYKIDLQGDLPARPSRVRSPPFSDCRLTAERLQCLMLRPCKRRATANRYNCRPFPTGVKATFGAGCFWHVEALFRRVPGVTGTAVGYAGGTVTNPSYEQVCSDTTGHAEAVQVEYDPARVTYAQLLDIFWGNHDPTTPNRQGPDVGTQYRSVIFFHDAGQEAAARESADAVAKSGRFARPVVTQIAPAPQFYRAEEYHQRYFERHGMG